MRQASKRIEIRTDVEGLIDITEPIEIFVADVGVAEGLLTVFCRHTSASLLIQENADPDVQRDLIAAFRRFAPVDGFYAHTAEGPDDMPAHIRAALSQTHLSIPIVEHGVVLGTWQGIYLFEHRRAPHRRTVALHIIGE